jgi:hypothetical protein
MKASTHTEVYRRFDGSLARWPLRPCVLAFSALRQGFKRKLPALLLFAPLAIATIINAFKVHLGYSLASADVVGDDPRMRLGGAFLQEVLGKTVHNILEFLDVTSVFGLLVVTWYGAGLIAEDRRLGANLLYFSRPLTRVGYFGGKLLATFTFGALATLWPCLVICSVASFSSPDWSFLIEEWDAILASMALCAIWTITVSLIVLAISSIVRRKTHALVGVIGVVMLSSVVGGVLSNLAKDRRFSLLSLFDNSSRLGRWLLLDQVDSVLGIRSTLLVIAALWVACSTVIASNLRRMEVVA